MGSWRSTHVIEIAERAHWLADSKSAWCKRHLPCSAIVGLLRHFKNVKAQAGDGFEDFKLAESGVVAHGVKGATSCRR
jgi:hypothetical protein